ncbi:serine hydrolase [Neobacillus terrae]|uniref:serine hydrolase n=1 Tax=Neobacillus terrae TaxID=3034837 RepID=UPI00140E92BA|nr:serine hydrolase [Neobacillus terrae]NHM30029.1 serine hydrolase [Neobacillus terrae]
MVRAASTIKLPLVLQVMELASQGKLNLNEKLTYKRYHYNGGSGIIQKAKVGTQYTIRDLVRITVTYSDNIGFVMLRERVGKQNFINYMRKLGGKYTYTNGVNTTSASDMVAYWDYLYNFSQRSPLGKELINYLKHTIYNTTILTGTRGVEVAHKVGMIPESGISHDVGIVYDKNHTYLQS